MSQQQLAVTIHGERDRTLTFDPAAHEHVESVIWSCLATLGNILPENTILFGLRTQSGHWLRPALKLTACPVEHVQLRLRFRFPPYRVTAQGKLRRPVRFTVDGGERLYGGGVGEYLFYQTRDDLLRGRLEIGEEHSFGTAMGIAVVDTLRLRAQEKNTNVFKDASNLKMKKLLPPKSASDLAKHNWFNIMRLNRSFTKSLKKEERKKEFETMSPEYFQEQYLANVEPLLRKTDWGEIYQLPILAGHEKDQGELWVHPEHGLKLRRRGESDWRKVADFSELLAISRVASRVTIQFTTLNHMEVELASEAHAIDLLLYLEGMNCLLVAAHHYFNVDMAFPSILEQNEINAFGPISRPMAESYLEPGQCLIRRSPEIDKSNWFYLMTRSNDNRINNYLIKKKPNGEYQFEGHDEAFYTLSQLLEDCVRNKSRLPFTISRRITPYSVGASRLQVIRASVADHIAFTSVAGVHETKFELPGHAMYPQSRLLFQETLTSSSKLAGGFNFTIVAAAQVKNQEGNGFERKVVVKKLDADPYKQKNVSGDSLRDCYHASIEFIHQINHPYITRMVGMITQTGAIILEKAAIGSLDKYLQLKCIQINQIDFDESLEESTQVVESSVSFDNNSSGQTNQSGNTVSFVLSDTYHSDGGSTSVPVEKKKKQRNWQAWHLECFWQIATALNYLQQRKMTHGNVRASNILIFNDNPQSSSPVIKLSDPGINAYSYVNSSTKHLALPPPWRPLEHLHHQSTERLSPTTDTWSFATTIAECSQWCQETLTRFGYPDDPTKFSQEQAQKYKNCQVAPLAEWIAELNPTLAHLLTRCWSPEPSLRSSMKELLREINTAKVIARQSDSSLTIPVPNNPSVMDDHMNIDTFDDSMLQHLSRLGQGHFGIVELCTYETDPLMRPGFNELVAVKSLRDSMRTQAIINDFQNEFQMMRKLDHKNIVKLRGLSIPSGRLVMEYIELGSLFSWLCQKNKQVRYRNNYICGYRSDYGVCVGMVRSSGYDLCCLQCFVLKLFS